MLLVTKQLPAIDFYSIFLTVSYTVEVNDNCLVTNIFHNILFYVQRIQVWNKLRMSKLQTSFFEWSLPKS